MPDDAESGHRSPRERPPEEPVIAIGLVLVVMLCLLLAATTAVALAADVAAGQENTTATTTPTESAPSESGYRLEELRQGGTQIAGAAPSMRWVGEKGAVYVDYENPNPLVLDSGEEWEAGEILSPGELVEAGGLRMHAQRQRGADDVEYQLVVVYWDTETVEVQEGETARTERRLANVTEQRHTLAFSGAFDHGSIDLRRSDETRQVTMWLEENGEPVRGARWTFEHRSPATTQSAPITTMGDLLGWVGKWIVLPLIVGIVGVSLLVREAIARAGRGPDMGPVFWGVVLTGILVLTTAVAWFMLADLLVALPIAIPVALAAFTAIVILETWESGVEEIEFVKPELELASSPTGEAAVDIVDVETTREHVVRTAPGEMSVARAGLRRFLSRCFGGAAPLEGTGDLSTRFDVSGDHDAKIFVHPFADHEGVLEYEPEGWTLETPEAETRGDLVSLAVIGVGGALLAGLLYSAFGPVWAALTLLGIGAGMTLRPETGRAYVDLAPAHMRAAFASMLYLAQEVDNADTIQEARKKVVEKEARSEKDVEEALTQRDSTLVREMFDVDVDDAVSELDGKQLEDLVEDAAENGAEPEAEVTVDDD